MYSSTLPSTSALDGGEWSTARPGHFTPGKTRYPFYSRLGGPQGRSGRVRKISPATGFDPRTVQSLASRYTDCAIPAGLTKLNLRKHIHSLSSGLISDRFEMWQQCNMWKCQVCIRLDNEQLCSTNYVNWLCIVTPLTKCTFSFRRRSEIWRYMITLQMPPPPPPQLPQILPLVVSRAMNFC
jgi:hypothetical protein